MLHLQFVTGESSYRPPGLGMCINLVLPLTVTDLCPHDAKANRNQCRANN